MTMQLSGDGTIVGLVAGGLPAGSVLPSNLDGGQSGLPPIYGARAGFNYKGTATRALRSSLNIASVTVGGTGDYEFIFTENMPHADYFVGLSWVQALGARAAGRTATIHSQTVSGFRVYCQDQAGAAVDFELLSAIVLC